MIKLIVLCILLPVTFICTLFINPKKDYDKNSPFFRKILYGYTWLVLKLLRVKVEIKDMEKLPKNTRFLLVGNHRSNFDPIITWQVFKEYDLAYISKPSLFRIPIFGRIIRRCCFMPIDRENPKNALKTVDRASNLIKSNEVSVAVYPEGTRNKKSKDLLPFHNSIFKIAQKANVPIVIVGIDGAEQIRKKVPWKKSVVKMEVLDVLSVESVKTMRTCEIGEITIEKLTKFIDTNKGDKENELHGIIQPSC